MAAAPELLELLEQACGQLDMCTRTSESDVVADSVRRRLAELGLWKLRADVRYPERHDPEDFNPDVDYNPRRHRR